MKLTLACVEWGNYLGRGEEYVRRLASMAERHAAGLDYEFVCLRPDVPGLTGWWNKIELFRPGRFKGRVVYLDLDTLITGPLPEIFETKGILHLDQWGWKTPTYGSGVMVWDAGEHADVFLKFTPKVARTFRGDQDWVTSICDIPPLPMARHRSFRYHCKAGLPSGTLTVSFHGRPKPHEVADAWVKEAWQ